MGSARDAGPEYVELRRLISTSADMFLVSTLPHDVSTLILTISLTDIPWFILDHTAIRTIQYGNEARYRGGHVSRMMEEFDLSGLVSAGLSGETGKICAYRCACGDGNLNVEHDDLRSK